MAAADWVLAANSLDAPDVAHGPSAGFTPPGGGGTFIYGVNSLTNVVGTFARYATPQSPNTNFNPMLSGGEISAAVQRGTGGGTTGMAAFIFLGLQGTDVGDDCYMLGLADGDPSHICLRKGSMSSGLPDVAPGGPDGILRRSTISFVPGTWVHLKLEMVVNGNGDVVLNCQYSTAVSVASPLWQAIPGISGFIDDALGVNSGSLPFVSGRAGFGASVADSVRRCFFDQLVLAKQT